MAALYTTTTSKKEGIKRPLVPSAVGFFSTPLSVSLRLRCHAFISLFNYLTRI